jgi:hypothetical protein
LCVGGLWIGLVLRHRGIVITIPYILQTKFTPRATRVLATKSVTRADRR